jgi:uncharacterized protein (TIGR02117 family)
VARSRSRRCGAWFVLASVVALAGCATSPVPIDDPGPMTTSITVVERGWHTDVCLAYDEAGTEIQALARLFPGATVLCFGFGERQYLLTHNPGLAEMISALFPSRSALLMTVLHAPPAAAFGAPNVVNLKISSAGLEGLKTYITQSVQKDHEGMAESLGPGPYEGSQYFAGTPTYDLFFTCNSWTADALHSARLPVHAGAMLSGSVMRDARRIATVQSGKPQ